MELSSICVYSFVKTFKQNNQHTLDAQKKAAPLRERPHIKHPRKPLFYDVELIIYHLVGSDNTSHIHTIT